MSRWSVTRAVGAPAGFCVWVLMLLILLQLGVADISFAVSIVPPPGSQLSRTTRFSRRLLLVRGGSSDPSTTSGDDEGEGEGEGDDEEQEQEQDQDQDQDQDNTGGTHSNTNTKNKSKKQNDIIEIFLQFIELNKNKFNKQILKTMDVYNEFNVFLTANNSNIDCKYNKLLSLLKQHCNIKAKSHEFSDGVAQGIYFPALIKSPSEDASDTSSETPWINPIESWLTGNYTVTKIQNDRIKCDELYNTYLKYSNSFITQKQFGQYMVILEHKSKSLHGVRYYVGILKNTDESTS